MGSQPTYRPLTLLVRRGWPFSSKGQVHVNSCGATYEAPFGGLQAVGNRSEAGQHGLQEYQEIKTVHFS